MPPASQRTTLLVGLFFLLGSAILGYLAVRFSREGSTSGRGYPLTVEVRDATGIRAGVPVRLGGVDIGVVSRNPLPDEDFTHLVIDLTIFEGNRIPAGSSVKVGTSGLLGDSFVRILPPESPVGGFLPPGHRILAEPAGSFNDLAENAGETLEEVSDSAGEIRAAVHRLDSLVARLDRDLFTEENLSNLRAALVEFRTTSEGLRAATERLGPALGETEKAMKGITVAAEEASGAFAGVDARMSQLDTTLQGASTAFSEFDRTLDDLRATLASVDRVLDEIEKGDGLASALLEDGPLKRDLQSFLDKLEKNGILLYPREGGLIRPSQTEKPDSPAPSESGEEKRPFPSLKRQP